jgi:hypothetical protein
MCMLYYAMKRSMLQVHSILNTVMYNNQLLCVLQDFMVNAKTNDLCDVMIVMLNSNMKRV